MSRPRGYQSPWVIGLKYIAHPLLNIIHNLERFRVHVSQQERACVENPRGTVSWARTHKQLFGNLKWRKEICARSYQQGIVVVSVHPDFVIFLLLRYCNTGSYKKQKSTRMLITNHSILDQKIKNKKICKELSHTLISKKLFELPKFTTC